MNKYCNFYQSYDILTKQVAVLSVSDVTDGQKKRKRRVPDPTIPRLKMFVFRVVTAYVSRRLVISLFGLVLRSADNVGAFVWLSHSGGNVFSSF